jgi:hypothetical protein
MKIILIAACTVVLAAWNGNTTINNAAKHSTANATADGWESLFDGKSLKGWHTYGKSAVNSRWKVANNTIYIDTASKEGGDIVTNMEYANFDLKLEWKISPNGNSGVIFYVHEDAAKYKETYKTGLEMQVLDNDGHSDGKIPKHRAGDLYDLIKSSSEPVKAVGEWNQVEIISNNGKLDLILNGVTVVSTTIWDDNWKKLIAGSKFKNMPDWGSFKSGKIALQDHGNTVWYRNIMIKKL